MGEGLYTHYLCIQSKMMMLTPLDSQIAAPNQFSLEMVCFFRGVGSVCDKVRTIFNIAVRISFFGKNDYFPA